MPWWCPLPALGHTRTLAWHLTHRLPPPHTHTHVASACRHGDRCSRQHNRPTLSPTILCANMYQNPLLNAPLGPDGLPIRVDPKQAQEHFEVHGRGGGRRRRGRGYDKGEVKGGGGRGCIGHACGKSGA